MMYASETSESSAESDKNVSAENEIFIELKPIYPDDDQWLTLLKRKYNAYVAKINGASYQLTNQEKIELQNELIQLEIEINHFD